MSPLTMTRKRKLEIMMDNVQTILDVGIMYYVYFFSYIMRYYYYNDCVLGLGLGSNSIFDRAVKRRLDYGVSDEVNLMATSYSKFVDGTLQHLKATHDTMAQDCDISTQLFKDLDKIDGLSEDDIIDAATVIIDSSTKTKLFFGMSDERRAIYVKNKILKP